MTQIGLVSHEEFGTQRARTGTYRNCFFTHKTGSWRCDLDVCDRAWATGSDTRVSSSTDAPLPWNGTQ